MTAIRPTSCIEILESRIAPATLVNPTTVAYRDIDGDHVIVKFNKTILDESTINDVFKFSTGTVDGSNATPQELQLIDLTALATLGAAEGANISVSAKRSGVHGGDGFANVGRIEATGIDLGAVTIRGDLGRIEVGNDATEKSFGLQSLAVQSVGEFGTSTQATGGELLIFVNGNLGGLTVKGNIREAAILIYDDFAPASIEKIAIGGSLIGGSEDRVEQISASGEIGTVHIGSSIIGGTGDGSASIRAQNLGSLTVQGDVRGGAGWNSGSILTFGGDLGEGFIGSVTIGGSLVGGTGDDSASLAAQTIGSVIVQGDVQGGTGDLSSSIFGYSSSEEGFIGSVTIGGSLIGGLGELSASITADLGIRAIKIGGDVRGGSGDSSAQIDSFRLSSVKISGSLIGGEGSFSASIIGGYVATYQDGPVDNIGSVTIGGSILGGSGAWSASIGNGELPEEFVFGHSSIGSIAVKGDVRGGTGNNSGRINTFSHDDTGGIIGSVKIGGSLLGGAGASSASITAPTIKAIKIGGDVQGALGDSSALIGVSDEFGGRIDSVHIGGSLIGGAGNSSASIAAPQKSKAIQIDGDVRGDTGNYSASIFGSGNGSFELSIGRSLIGGNGLQSAVIYVTDGATKVHGHIIGGTGDGSASISSGGFASLIVDGSVRSGRGLGSSSIDGLRSVTIGGDVIGSAAQPVTIEAYSAIHKVSIGGTAQFTLITCGVDKIANEYGEVIGNPDAHIGSVTVGGDWIASSIAAGVAAKNGFFGDSDDTKSSFPSDSLTVASRIASITIKGRALGTAGGTDHFGFVAQKIGSVSIGGIAFPLTNGAANDDLDANDPLLVVNSTNDTRVHEIAL